MVNWFILDDVFVWEEQGISSSVIHMLKLFEEKKPLYETCSVKQEDNLGKSDGFKDK
jgi:hypothetical protein